MTYQREGNDKCEQFLYYKIDYYTQTGDEMMSALKDYFPIVYEKLILDTDADANLSGVGYMNILNHTTVGDFINEHYSTMFAGLFRLRVHNKNSQKFAAFLNFIRTHWDKN